MTSPLPKPSLDKILEGFNSDNAETKSSSENAMIGVWVPGHYKEKYDALQKKSNREFGKKLRELICTATDIAWSEKP